MSSLKDLTIFLFESAWTDDFKEDEGFLPQASVLPYVKALSENSGCNVVYRQIRTEDDFKTWANAIKHSKAGTRVVWIAGHGIESEDVIKVRMPDYKKTSTGNLLSPKTIKEWLGKSGKIDGIIIDSCNFGENEAITWMPDDVMWGLAYRASVNWTESVFFGIKTLEWLYERSDHPKNGKNAKEIFERGILTGAYRRKEDQFSLKEFGESLMVIFNYGIKGSPYWQTLEYDKSET